MSKRRATPKQRAASRRNLHRAQVHRIRTRQVPRDRRVRTVVR